MNEEQKDTLRTLLFALEEGEVIAEARDDWQSLTWTNLRDHSALVDLSLRLTSMPVEELLAALNYPVLYQALEECLPNHLSELFSPDRLDAYTVGQILYPLIEEDSDDFVSVLGQAGVSLDDDLNEEIEDLILEHSEPLQAWFESEKKALYLSGFWETSSLMRGELKALSNSSAAEN